MEGERDEGKEYRDRTGGEAFLVIGTSPVIVVVIVVAREKNGTQRILSLVDDVKARVASF